MKLAEAKGKELLASQGIEIPEGVVVSTSDQKECEDFFDNNDEVVVKAQVLGGSRKKQGLIFEVADYSSAQKDIDALFEKTHDGVLIDQVLLEAKLDVAQEFFLSVMYDTKTRRPIILFSDSGGIEIENNSDQIKSIYPQKVSELTLEEVGDFVPDNDLAEVLVKAYQTFIEYDCTHLEINPIIKTKDGKFFAADAKITIDDNALARQEAVSADDEKMNFSELEIKARAIDLEDHRGVAGKTFVELDGDIAVLASGGGASLTAMDALIEAGGKPANYTEYSGNPPREKVEKLTEVTLSKPGLKGCLVIGGTANFTDIYETLSGFVDGLKKLSELPKYPIVIRRAGPRDKEAFEVLEQFAKENSMDITLFGEETPMSYAAKVMAEKVV